MMSELDSKGSMLPELTSPTKDTQLIVVEGIGEAPETMRLSMDNAMKAGVDAIYLGEQASAPAPPPSGTLLIFSQGGKFYVEDSSGTVSEVGSGSVSPGMTNVRLSLSSTEPIPFSPQTSKTAMYALPFLGNRIALYDSEADVYADVPVPTNLFIQTSQGARTGDTANGSNVISDFSGFWFMVFEGYQISGTNIPADTYVTAVDMVAKTITMDKAATGDGNDVTLTLRAPDNSKWDVFAHLVGGAMRIHLEKWASASARATGLAESDGIVHLDGDKAYKYLGTVTITGTIGRMEDSPGFRGVYNHYKVPGGLWRLDKASGITTPLVGGVMGTVQKQAASWTFQSGMTWGTTANIYDGDLETYAQLGSMNHNSNSGYWLIVDFGEKIVLEEIHAFFESETLSFTTFNVYTSETGAFAGEESLVSATHISSWSSGLWKRGADFNAPAQSRYWKIFLQRNSANTARIYEMNFLYGGTLAIWGVPWGCKVELLNSSGGSIASQVSQQFLRPGVVEFTSDVSSVARITVSRPDGLMPWLDFGISAAVGDIFTFLME